MRHALTRQPHRAATRRMATAGFHTVQAGRIDDSLSPRRRARFLTKSSPSGHILCALESQHKDCARCAGDKRLSRCVQAGMCRAWWQHGV